MSAGHLIAITSRFPFKRYFEGAGVAGITSFKYRAFLSYSHSDIRWAKWLHSRLEAFRFDNDPIGHESPLGPVPRTLRPIFRDREDFSGGHSLTEATVAALDDSAALIVLCSPIAAGRPAVNEEVRLFRSRHPDRPTIPVIVGGTWPDNYPPALRFELASDGSITDRPVTVLGPDLQEGGDGKNLGLAKIVAGLTGLSTDDIFRRAERARRRRMRFAAGLAALFLLLAVAATGSAVYAYQKLVESNERLDEAIEIAYGIVTKATAMSDRYGVPQELTLDLLGQAENALNGLMARGADTAMLRHRKALMLISFCDSYRLLGRYNDAMRRAAEAHQLLVDLTERNPNNVEWQDELAIAEYKIGDIQMYFGHYVEALEQFRAAVQLFKRYPDQKSSGAISFSGEGSASYYRVWASSWLGLMQSFVGDADAALVNAEIGHDLARRVVSENPNDAIGKRNLDLSDLVVCIIMRTRGDYAEGISHCRVAVAATKGLVLDDPGNSRWLRDLAWTELHLAAALIKLGSVDEAIDVLQSAISIDERLVASDAKNILWTWHLWTGYFQLAQVQLRLGKIDEALAKCRASIALVEPMALRDDRNFLFRRQVGWSHLCIGDAQKAQSDPNGALENYRRGFELLAELAQLDTKSAQRKSDIAWGYIKVGDALLALDRKGEAVADFQKASALSEQIASADPNNVDWEQVLLWSEWRLSEQGDESATRLRDMTARMRKLKIENRLSVDLVRLLPIAEGRLAKLSTE